MSLVLTRRKGDFVVVNDGHIVISVLSIKGKQVRLGFDAPKEVKINRASVRPEHKGNK